MFLGFLGAESLRHHFRGFRSIMDEMTLYDARPDGANLGTLVRQAKDIE